MNELVTVCNGGSHVHDLTICTSARDPSCAFERELARTYTRAGVCICAPALVSVFIYERTRVSVCMSSCVL